PAQRASVPETPRMRNRGDARFPDRPGVPPAKAVRRRRSTRADRPQSCCTTDWRERDGQPINSLLVWKKTLGDCARQARRHAGQPNLGRERPYLKLCMMASGYSKWSRNETVTCRRSWLALALIAVFGLSAAGAGGRASIQAG